MSSNALVGTYIGRFKIEELLGRGGMAEVYKAFQVNLGRHVAIKVMHKFLSDDEDFLARFEREAKAMAATKHPNIVDVYDFDVDNEHYYIAMEYLSGGTLKNKIDRLSQEGSVLNLGEAVKIVIELGDALSYAHSQGMVHRDIKPANIMFNDRGSAILTDFGIARMLSNTSHTTTGSMIGTPAYMSPEQGLGETGTEKSDIYSLGVLAYHLFTGRFPFEGETPLGVVLKHVNEMPEPLTSFNPDIPYEIEMVVLKSLEKDPDDRYQKVTDFANDSP